MNKKIILVDGHSLVFRAFYGIRPLQSSKGQDTNAIMGFFRMILKLINDEKPEGLAVAFDVGKTFRHDMYDDYKAGRKSTPEELRTQFPIIMELLKYMGIEILTYEGFEADDVIGTLAKKGSEKEDEILLVTGDKDYFQLVNEYTSVIYTKRGISDVIKITPDSLKEIYEIEPFQVPEMKGLEGDPSDNIKGVPGVGKKTALKLIKEYGTIKNIYDNIDSVKGNLQQKLRDHQEDAFFSRELATIHLDVDIEYTNFLYGTEKGDEEKLVSLLQELELNSLIKALAINGDNCKNVHEDVEVNTQDLSDFSVFLNELENGAKRNEMVSFYMNSYDLKNLNDLEISFYLEDNKTIYKYEVQGLLISSLGKEDFQKLRDNLSGYQKCVYSEFKGFYKLLRNYDIIYKNENFEDLTLMRYAFESEKKCDFPNILKDYLDLDSANKNIPYFIFHLYNIFKEKLDSREVNGVYENIDKKIVVPLGEMETHGIKIDVETLKEIQLKTQEKLDNLEMLIYELAKEEFNINSPKQMGVILFEKLGLKGSKKTKTGYSTKQEVLDKLVNEHEIIPLILEYRKFSKLQSTYIKGFLDLCQDTNIIHTNYNQVVAVTGRLSSENPNLQNIPMRTPEGKNLRRVFVPVKEGNILVCGDYSQVELRVLAHMSQDEKLIAAFNNDLDIHTITAMEVFGLKEDEVTKDHRRKAKAVNFGIIYGISDFGLSRDLGISRGEAKEYIEKYFLTYGSIRAFFDNLLLNAKEDLKVRTTHDRLRNLPELKSPNHILRSQGERMALNAPIQGTAADIMKLGLIKVRELLLESKLSCAIVLQIHDELVIECAKEDRLEVTRILKEGMEHAYELVVPLKVDIKWGEDLLNMKEI